MVMRRMDMLLNEIRQCLGVPFVNLIFHRLSAWPDYLERVWRLTLPLLSTQEFARAAHRLSELAAPAFTAPLQLPQDLTASDLGRAVSLTDAYAHVQPKLLLLVAGWASGLSSDRPFLPPTQVSAVSTEHPMANENGGDAGGQEADVPMIPLPPADPTVACLFASMVQCRRHPGVASYYRSLANWPSLLAACWEILEPVTTGPGYMKQADLLSRTAAELSGALGLDAAGAVRTPDRVELSTLLLQWRDVQVPQLMIDTRYLAEALKSASRCAHRR
jgi:hypothetical protein